MRTIVIISAALMLASLPAMAYRRPSAAPSAGPYLGIILQFNNPTGDFGNDRLAPDGYLYPGDGAADGSAGVELDVGLANRNMNAYLGYRANKFNVNSPDGWQGDWHTNRMVIGVRGNLLTGPEYNVVPTVGGGISLGRTRLEGALPGDYLTERKSDLSLGWFIEGGINAHISESADLLANLQYHSFEADFPNRPYADEKFDISFVTLQVGVAVYLGGGW